MSADNVAERLGALLVERDLTLCTAESCTGGLAASIITDVPGSSRYFLGSIVAYANQAKIDLLGVPPSLLNTFGAVSAPVALAMARGARKAFEAKASLAITGIAGPTGGTAEKPVGLVYIAIVAPGYAACHRFIFAHDRAGNKRHSALTALSLLIQTLSPGS